ncbi:DHH family phosphoesterase [Haloimpatiens sp. FM7315]|uniref:DHH family phosphoesterase n=1 Tax=Haloimpatiens sp. FM7315 TaxID=3298609 RepID=UPI0035A2EC12
MKVKRGNSMSKEDFLFMTIYAVSTLILWFYNVRLGFVMTCFYVVVAFSKIKKVKLSGEEWKKLQMLSSKVDIAGQNNLVKLPIPVLIVSEEGNIFWYNEKFHKVIKDEEILGKDIKTVGKELEVRSILEDKIDTFSYVKVNDKFYDVNASVVNISESEDKESIIILYFIDVSEKYAFFNEIEESKESIILIEVDNLEEVIKNTEEDKRPFLMAEIEKTINNYGQNLNAMIEKYSSNRYVLSVQNKYISVEMDKKFDILDHIRDLTIGNKLSATLSIGVGTNGGTPQNNHKYAMAAIDLALGRGGDQAVVKNKDRLFFYGGKTKEIEKRTKVRARVIGHALLELIKESDNIIIMGHINPDLDCFGAAIGINSVVKMFNKKCNIVLDKVNSGIKVIYNVFKGLEEYEGTFITSESAKRQITEGTLLILVDVHGIDYVQNKEIAQISDRIVIIDHHRKGANYIRKNILSYIETYASSTSELITEMLQYMVDNPKLKVEEAEALLAGICVDTKNFYFKTGVRTFEAAAFLRRAGADTIEIKKLFSNDLDKYLKRAEIIKSAKVSLNIAIAICPEDINDTIIAAQAADELLNITGIKASFVLVQKNNEVFISGRSLGDINVQVILERLGGGGHITMAGVRLIDTSIQKVYQKLQSEITKYLKGE